MIEAKWIPYDLRFKFRAGTSRGFLSSKTSYFLWIRGHNNRTGIGECGPLSGLSPDYRQGITERLTRLCNQVENSRIPGTEGLVPYLDELLPDNWPSLRMGLETAILDLLNGGRRVIFDNDFIAGREIKINGLIWMGNKKFMKEQVDRKFEEGYRCIKMKIGALDFEVEKEVLQYIISLYSGRDFSIRVDANGSFTYEEAKRKLGILSDMGLHSIEQPIRPGNPEMMAKLCRETELPIALDEELIGEFTFREKMEMLDLIKPRYIVLKPTLLGGFEKTREWIRLAGSMGIGWWITSALESNIGLNAIAQFAMDYEPSMEQGLGTGQLYHNNFPSPLQLAGGKLFMDQGRSWDLSGLGIDDIQDHTGNQPGGFRP